MGRKSPTDDGASSGSDSRRKTKSKSSTSCSKSSKTKSKEKDSSKSFPLSIRKQPYGEAFWIEVEPSTRISSCKKKIQKLRGIPSSNIRLAIVSSSPDESSFWVIDNDKSGYDNDDFQERTLKSLGITGGDDSLGKSRNESVFLELAAISLYVRTPSGQIIFLEDSVDVECTVDHLEELIASRLISDGVQEYTEHVAESKRLMLSFDGSPLNRGHAISKFCIQDRGVLEVAFVNRDYEDGDFVPPIEIKVSNAHSDDEARPTLTKKKSKRAKKANANEDARPTLTKKKSRRIDSDDESQPTIPKRKSKKESAKNNSDEEERPTLAKKKSKRGGSKTKADEEERPSLTKKKSKRAGKKSDSDDEARPALAKKKSTRQGRSKKNRDEDSLDSKKLKKRSKSRRRTKDDSKRKAGKEQAKEIKTMDDEQLESDAEAEFEAKMRMAAEIKSQIRATTEEDCEILEAKDEAKSNAEADAAISQADAEAKAAAEAEAIAAAVAKRKETERKIREAEAKAKVDAEAADAKKAKAEEASKAKAAAKAKEKAEEKQRKKAAEEEKKLKKKKAVAERRRRAAEEAEEERRRVEAEAKDIAGDAVDIAEEVKKEAGSDTDIAKQAEEDAAAKAAAKARAQAKAKIAAAMKAEEEAAAKAAAEAKKKAERVWGRVEAKAKAKAEAAAAKKAEIKAAAKAKAEAGADALRKIDSRTVIAPAGKLGLMLADKIDSTGCVVLGVQASSAMKDKLSVGDWIVAIDGESVTRKTYDDIIDIICNKGEYDREFTVVPSNSPSATFYELEYDDEEEESDECDGENTQSGVGLVWDYISSMHSREGYFPSLQSLHIGHEDGSDSSAPSTSKSNSTAVTENCSEMTSDRSLVEDNDIDTNSDIDSQVGDDLDSFYVMTSDLSPLSIQIDSAKSVSDVKDQISRVSGIPVSNLRLVSHEDIPIVTDSFNPSTGDILTAKPSTVHVALPDHSEMHLSAFPNAQIGDVKDFIEGKTHLNRSKQVICFLETDCELDDATLIENDTSLQLTTRSYFQKRKMAI